MSYAFVTMIYGNQSHYINGVILMALGLRKQNVKQDIICLITKDNLIYKEILEKIFDFVYEVPYISSIKHDEDTILISEKICKPNDSNNDFYTKFNIFNKKILDYKKIIYIDSDLIPIRNFEKLFEYQTPAGWLEKDNNGAIVWGHWDFEENQIIPDRFTNQLCKYNNCINAGLLVIEPDNIRFNILIEKLQNYEKFKINHLGGFNKYGYFEKDYYQYYDQSFLTHEFSGNWHYVNALYNTWSFDNFDIFGIHMAGLHKIINDKKENFKTWQFQLNEDHAYNYFTNITFIYGLINFPFIKEIILKDLQISINSKLYLLRNIPNDMIEYLSATQKILFDMFKESDKDFLKKKNIYKLLITFNSKFSSSDFNFQNN